jgi:NAD(P)H-dependent FMN reductase
MEFPPLAGRPTARNGLTGTRLSGFESKPMITVISGTNRINNVTRRVAGMVMDHYSKTGVEAQLIDLCDLPRDLFVPESYGKGVPDSFQPFQEQMLNCNGLLTVIPEYNGSFPGVLKYFIDLLKFPESLHDMPSAFIGLAAGQFGALRAIEQLEMVFQYREAHIYGKRCMFPAVHKMLTEDNQITDDFVRGLFVAQLDGFADFAYRLKPKG